MHRKYLHAATTLAFMVVMCISWPAATQVAQPPMVLAENSSPKPGVTTRVAVGEVMTSQHRYAAFRGARLKEAVVVDHNGRTYREGTELICTVAGPGGRDCLRFCPLKWRGPCLVDQDQDRVLDKIWPPPNTGRKKEKTPQPAARYELFDWPQSPVEGFQRELIYQGTAGGVLRIAYREYKNDLARPAFSQELTYEYNDTPTDLVFKDVKLRVTSADNQQITFEVLSLPGT